MYLQNSSSDRSKTEIRVAQKERERKRSLSNGKHLIQKKKKNFNLTPSVPFDNPNSGRQAARVLTPSETQAWRERRKSCTIKSTSHVHLWVPERKNPPRKKHYEAKPAALYASGNLSLLRWGWRTTRGGNGASPGFSSWPQPQEHSSIQVSPCRTPFLRKHNPCLQSDIMNALTVSKARRVDFSFFLSFFF